MRSVSEDESDQVVMRRVQAGEKEAFAELVRRYQVALLRVARSRLKQSEVAEDIVQETFLAAFKSRHTFDHQFGFRTWLWTILLNQCHRHAGRQARRPRETAWSTHHETQVEPSLDAATAEPDALARLLAAEKTAALTAMLDRLPENQADALRLRFFGELKFDEIADVMHCTPGTAKNRVKAGLLRLAMLAAESNQT